MKKGLKILIIIVLVLVVIGLGGLYILYSSEMKSMEKVMNESARDYYTNYMSSNTGSSAYKVTLEDLKNAEGDYNLTKLNSCNAKTTVATVNINYSNGKVTSVASKLDCKIFFK